jgi:hypothetical protein
MPASRIRAPDGALQRSPQASTAPQARRVAGFFMGGWPYRLLGLQQYDQVFVPDWALSEPKGDAFGQSSSSEPGTIGC